jgi:hypothetical protein
MVSCRGKARPTSNPNNFIRIKVPYSQVNAAVSLVGAQRVMFRSKKCKSRLVVGVEFWTARYEPN